MISPDPANLKEERCFLEENIQTVSKVEVSKARTVLRWLPVLAEQVLAGSNRRPFASLEVTPS